MKMKPVAFNSVSVAFLVTWAAMAHGLVTAATPQQVDTAVEIGSIHLTQAVLADGRVLRAGTYQVRLTNDQPTPAVGQSPGSERWVEFVRDRTVVGREVATVVAAEDIDTVAKGPRPKANGSRVDVPKGGDYVRVWINRGGTNYLINMPPAR